MTRLETSNMTAARDLLRRQGQATKAEIAAVIKADSPTTIKWVMRSLLKQRDIKFDGATVLKTVPDGRIFKVRVYKARTKTAAVRELAGAHKTLKDVQPNAVRAIASRKNAAKLNAGWPAGYFTELIRAHNFPPSFASRIDLRVSQVALLQTIKRREDDARTGVGFGAGLQVMTGSTHKRPELMGYVPGVSA